jgi:hypothetical protein
MICFTQLLEVNLICIALNAIPLIGDIVCNCKDEKADRGKLQHMKRVGRAMWELLDGDDSAGIKDSELCQDCARIDLESQDREEEVNQVERALLQELYRKKAVREASAKDDFGYWACAEWLEAFKKRSLAPSGKTPPALWDDINDKLRCPHANGFKAGTRKKLLSPGHTVVTLF